MPTTINLSDLLEQRIKSLGYISDISLMYWLEDYFDSEVTRSNVIREMIQEGRIKEFKFVKENNGLNIEEIIYFHSSVRFIN